ASHVINPAKTATGDREIADVLCFINHSFFGGFRHVMDARLSAAKAINKRASSIRIAIEITWSRVISFRARVSVLHRKAPVESKIQAKYVHAWFAKKPEVRTVCVVGDYLLRLL